MHLRSGKPGYTKEEKPGSGALDLAMLFMTIWVPLRLTTALEASCNAFIFEVVESHLITVSDQMSHRERIQLKTPLAPT